LRVELSTSALGSTHASFLSPAPPPGSDFRSRSRNVATPEVLDSRAAPPGSQLSGASALQKGTVPRRVAGMLVGERAQDPQPKKKLLFCALNLCTGTHVHKMAVAVVLPKSSVPRKRTTSETSGASTLLTPLQALPLSPSRHGGFSERRAGVGRYAPPCHSGAPCGAWRCRHSP
jgi:hypothetical protein